MGPERGAYAGGWDPISHVDNAARGAATVRRSASLAWGSGCGSLRGSARDSRSGRGDALALGDGLGSALVAAGSVGVPPASLGSGLPPGPGPVSGRSLPPLTTGAGSTAASVTPTNPRPPLATVIAEAARTMTRLATSGPRLSASNRPAASERDAATPTHDATLGGRAGRGHRQHPRPIVGDGRDLGRGVREADREQPSVVQDRQEDRQQDDALERAVEGEGDDLRPRVEREEPRPAHAGHADRDQGQDEERRPERPAAELADPARPVASPDRDRPGRERRADREQHEDPGPARGPDRRVEDREREDDDAGVLDGGVADDVLEVLLDPRRDRPEHDAGDADGEDDERARSAAGRSTGATGAMDPSTQARPTTARAAGPQAMRSGSATSGAASATRAAQRWNGIAPKRIAMPTATAR